jgi:hypothetical protein
MTITINLPRATLEQLKAEAQATGKDVDTVVREAVEARLARRQLTFAEILKPVHDAIEASGISEEEVIGLLEKELKAVREERRSAQSWNRIDKIEEQLKKLTELVKKKSGEPA